MEATGEESRGRRTRRRQDARPIEAEHVSKVKVTIHLAVESEQRLKVHAAMRRASQSELVEGLINAHLREYVVQRRGPTPLPGPSAVAAGEAGTAVETLPITEGINPSPIVDASASPGGGEGPEPASPPLGRRRRGA